MSQFYSGVIHMPALVCSPAQIEHEQAVIRAFFLPEKQERFLGLLSTPKNRKKLIHELAHFRGLDQRFVSSIRQKTDPTLKLRSRHSQDIDNIVDLLKSRGATGACWVISENTDLDGKEMNLKSALEDVIGRDMATILSCIPGKLAVFVGEDEALLLAK